MEAPVPKHPWNYHSHVTVCSECDGAGVVHANRRATINDPYPETVCQSCDGPHEPECPVCGYGLKVQGYDCLACDTAASLYESELIAFDADSFAQALGRAVIAARADMLRETA